ncbi:MAG TPA: biopolymer transporter ExbD [Kiritimatiellia bacterium]|nr:biopolymer transporter ExbD [Kiritimatiellia bacterium]
MAETVPPSLFVFRRHFSPSRRAPRGLLSIAPWVDLALVFLLVLIQLHATVLRPGVRLELPAAAFVDGARPGALVLTVPQEDMYFFQDERLTLDGLAIALARAARAQEDAALIVEADQRVAYGTLVALCNLARDAGIRDVMLATRLGLKP